MELNRKAFIAGAAAASLAGAASLARADDARPDWMPQAWDYESDAVIIGFGAAGAGAAIALGEQGIDTILLEKLDYELAGGDMAVCGGYLIPVTTVDDYVASTMGYVDDDYAASILQYVIDAPDYLASHGVELDLESFPGAALPVRAEGEAYGQALFRAVRTAVESYADTVEVMYETPAIDLVQNPVTGEVLGVKAGSAEAPIYVRARRGVLVASGSYEGDRVMTNAIHMPGLLFPTIGSPFNTGDGLKMLMKAGCKVQNFGKSLEYAAMAVAPASEEVGVGLVLPFAFANDGYIFVNRDGKRFMDETVNIQHSKNDSIFQVNQFFGDLHSNKETTKYLNLPAFMVFDEATKVAQAIAGTNGNGNGWNVHTQYQWSADNQAEVDCGWIFKADTLEELAEVAVARDIWGNEVHIDVDGLLEQVQRYNDACDAGEDADFGRATGAKIGDGPFYAAEIIPATLYATGGASHDVNAQAIDWAEQPIPRLYMAGLVGDPFTLHSSAVVGAVAWGRRAAEQIAAQEPWA